MAHMRQDSSAESEEWTWTVIGFRMLLVKKQQQIKELISYYDLFFYQNRFGAPQPFR